MFLLVAPFVFSFSCDSIICSDIDLSELFDKDYFKVNTLVEDNYYPYHDFVYDYNTAIEIDEAPDDLDTEEGSYVENAWLKIFSLMPSVFINETLYVPSNFEVLTGYGYDAVIPDDLDEEDEEEVNEYGDCKTEFEVENENAYLHIYVNEVFVGNNDLQPVSVVGDSTILARLFIEVELEVEHYLWDYEDDEWICEYDYSTYESDVIELEDSIDISLYSEIPFAQLTPLYSYKDTKVGRLDSVNTNYELQILDEGISHYQYLYELNYSYPPYYFLEYHVRDVNITKVDYMIYDNGKVYFLSNSCAITFWNHFYTYEQGCDLNYPETELAIETDQLIYEPGEDIVLELYPKNVLLNVTYGNYSAMHMNEAVLTATDYTRISVSDGNRETFAIIHVKDLEIRETLLLVFSFCVACYFVYILLKHTWGKIDDMLFT